MVQKDVAAHKAVVLNADTGLIGMPQQTIGAGVNIRCLINTNIRLHGLVQLDQGSVYRAELSDDQVLKAGGPSANRRLTAILRCPVWHRKRTRPALRPMASTLSATS